MKAHPIRSGIPAVKRIYSFTNFKIQYRGSSGYHVIRLHRLHANNTNAINATINPIKDRVYCNSSDLVIWLRRGCRLFCFSFLFNGIANPPDCFYKFGLSCRFLHLFTDSCNMCHYGIVIVFQIFFSPDGFKKILSGHHISFM